MRDCAELQRAIPSRSWSTAAIAPGTFGRLERHTHHAEGYNPLCGDRFTVYVQVEDGVIRDVSFEGSRLHDLQGLGLADDHRGRREDGQAKPTGSSMISTRWS